VSMCRQEQGSGNGMGMAAVDEGAQVSGHVQPWKDGMGNSQCG